MILLLLIMYGNAWNPLDYFNNCSIAIVNYDSSSTLMNSALNTALNRITTVSGYGFKVDLFNASTTTIQSFSNDVAKGKFWGALIIKNGTTATLSKALFNTSVTYDNSQFISFTVDQGRGGTYIYSALRIWSTGLVTIISTVLAQAFLSASTAANSTLGTLNSQVISSPVGLFVNNLHPVYLPGLDAVLVWSCVYIFCN
jgi:Protein of unknown function (DUF3533)